MASAATNDGPFIVEVIIEDFNTSKVLKQTTYTAEAAVKVIVRERVMIDYRAELPLPNPKQLYKDKVTTVTLEAVKKPEPPIHIGQVVREI